MERIERSTSPLPRECSTTELHGRLLAPQPCEQDVLDACPPATSGAGEGNRTLVVSLEGFCSTIELHPQPPEPTPASRPTGPATLPCLLPVRSSLRPQPPPTSAQKSPYAATTCLVEGEGFEPSKAWPADLQSAPFDRSGTPPNETRDFGDRWPACQIVGIKTAVTAPGSGTDCECPRSRSAYRQSASPRPNRCSPSTATGSSPR